MLNIQCRSRTLMWLELCERQPTQTYLVHPNLLRSLGVSLYVALAAFLPFDASGIYECVCQLYSKQNDYSEHIVARGEAVS